ncbi:MAG: S41 family peptidase [Bacteroidales bacterium]|nr:S41 family peptidase [Bacteroidales bacterium]
MMIKRIAAVLFAAAGICLSLGAQNSPSWIRSASISPDGKTIAFAWQGDIWTVPVGGGLASQITTNPAHETDPMWTPDGSRIVFSSTRELSKDIWSVPARGGRPTRITTFPGNETPLTVTPDSKLVFWANILPDPAYSGFPSTPQIYEVSLEGGKPRMIFSIPMMNMSFNAAGDVLYEDYKGYEDSFRKHHTSSVTRDIWLCSKGVYRQLSDFKGEDRNPVFGPDGDRYYYISERDGTLNVWSGRISDPTELRQITRFTTNPVRNLSVASDGTLLFGWNGSLYTCRDGAEPSKVSIEAVKDQLERDVVRKRILGGVTDCSPSHNGKEVAIVSRGEIFVSAVDFSSTARVTETPYQERGVSFAPDGKTVYYAAEKNGHWGIYRSSPKDKKAKFLSLETDFEEEQFSDGDQTCFQPAVSPDGKWVAFLRDRTEIVIKSTKGKEERSLLKGANYSYRDGDLDFAWSPDSRYILTDYGAQGGWNNSDIALIDIEKGTVTNLTCSGYSDGGFRWALGGKAMTWTSDKAGYRSHGSWGAERDIYIMFFDRQAYTDFLRNENDTKIEKAVSASDKKKSDSKDKDKKDSTKVEKVKPLELDLENLEDRTIRLTSNSGRLGGHILSPDGEKLYYVASGLKGSELLCMEVKSRSIKVVSSGIGGFVASPDGKSIYFSSLFGISKMDLASGKRTSISFSGEYQYRADKEREYIFEHIWKQVKEKFYDADIHGIDWQGIHDNYASFLPDITDNYAFQELLSEMLGELNGSHTGARYRTSVGVGAGRLGVLYDDSFDGEGLRIAEVLPGSCLGNAYPSLKAGDVITAVNGKPIAAGSNWYDVLLNKYDKRTVVSVKSGSKTSDVVVYPTKSDTELLYRRWVRRNEETVARLSGGKVGYVHVKGMDSDSFREVYSKALGKYRSCDALIVDTRHNGGGWLHDDLATFLSGKAYIEFRPRGQYIGTEPFSKWTKPSCVLMGEDNYSDACGFPYVYKTLGLGKLIGAPVPGTMTAVWWEYQVDSSIVFGIPQVTSWGLKENRPLENLQIEPDILVYNDPASVAEGRDIQLERAVQEMLGM